MMYFISRFDISFSNLFFPPEQCSVLVLKSLYSFISLRVYALSLLSQVFPIVQTLGCSFFACCSCMFLWLSRVFCTFSLSSSLVGVSYEFSACPRGWHVAVPARSFLQAPEGTVEPTPSTGLGFSFLSGDFSTSVVVRVAFSVLLPNPVSEVSSVSH